MMSLLCCGTPELDLVRQQRTISRLWYRSIRRLLKASDEDAMLQDLPSKPGTQRSSNSAIASTRLKRNLKQRRHWSGTCSGKSRLITMQTPRHDVVVLKQGPLVRRSLSLKRCICSEVRYLHAVLHSPCLHGSPFKVKTKKAFSDVLNRFQPHTQRQTRPHSRTAGLNAPS